MRKLTTVSLSLLLLTAVRGQVVNGGCFYSEGFEGPDPLISWDLGDAVETQSASGMGLGEFIPAWRISNASEANSDGYFPVVDQPYANRFVTANDAASPCNCAMNDVTLTSPAFDLTGRMNVAFECRIFNEMAFGSGAAVAEADRGDGNWNLLDTLPVSTGAWQPVLVDLSAYDNEPSVHIRFRWSDGGTWASGLAVDDLCLRERLGNNLSLLGIFANDATVPPFVQGDQSLRYFSLPLEQTSEFTLVAELKNSGTSTLRNISVTASITLAGSDQGTFTGDLLDSLVPNESSRVRIPTAWTPAMVGELVASFNATADGTDEQLGDNSGSFSMRITGPGWENGYSVMAVEQGIPSSVYGDTSGIVLANRMEIINTGSHAEGISVLLGAGSAVGEEVRAVLLDGNYSFVDTAQRQTISQVDLDNASFGVPLYAPLPNRPELPPGDYFVGIQHLQGTEPGRMEVALSGEVQIGASVLLEGLFFDITYLYSAPMIRLHLGELGVGVGEVSLQAKGELAAFPVPMDRQGTLRFELMKPGRAQIRIIDAAGRSVSTMELGELPPGFQSVPIWTGHLDPGSYTAVLFADGHHRTVRFIVAH